MTEKELLEKAMNIINGDIVFSHWTGSYSSVVDVMNSFDYCMNIYGGITVYEMLQFFHDTEQYVKLALQLTVRDKTRLNEYGWCRKELDCISFIPIRTGGFVMEHIPEPIKLV